MRDRRLSLRCCWWLLLVAVSLTAFKVFIVDEMHTPFRHPTLSSDGTLPGVEHPLERSYADGLELIGYDQNAAASPTDDLVTVDLYWTVRERPSRRYQSVVHLVGPEGFRWSKSDSFRPRGYQGAPPTDAWTPGRYALDSHEIEPLPGTPPGRYDVVLTVFDRETLAPLSVLDAAGQPTAPELTLDQVTLTAPRQPVDPSSLAIPHQRDMSLGSLTLLGAMFDPGEAAPGDPVWVTTVWRAEEQPQETLTLNLELLAPGGKTVAEYARPPAASWHPTSAWRPGDVWRGQHLVHLPAELDTGTYTWTLSLSPSAASAVALSQVSVTAPDRTFSPPAVDIETQAPLGKLVTLVGARVEPTAKDLTPGAIVTVALVWRAEAETSISYRVFVHLTGPDGELVAQSDGVPAAWGRPTTGWLPGEYVTDVHTLKVPEAVPPGPLALQVGLYAPGGERLTTPGGATAVPLTTVMIRGKE